MHSPPDSRSLQSILAKDAIQRDINVKYEDIIESRWMMKVNHRGGNDSRFIVMTTAALYVYKSVFLTRNLKLSRLHPWISLRRIEFEGIDKAKLQFGIQTLTLIHSSIVEILEPVGSYLLSFLPKHVHRYLVFPLEIERGDPKDTRLFDMALSFHKYHGIALSPTQMSALRRALRDPESISLSLTSFSENSLSATAKAIINLGQTHFVHLSYLKSDAVLDILVSDREIETISLEEPEFSVSCWDSLFSSFSMSRLANLRFIRCSIPGIEDKVRLLVDGSISKTLRSLEFCRSPISQSTIYQIMALLSHTNIECISFIGVEVDVAQFLSESDWLPKRMVLSRNVCSEDAVFDTPLSYDLESLSLNEVLWNGNSLSTFLSNVQALGPLELDLSDAKYTANNPFHDLSPVPVAQTVYRLNWSRNLITDSILQLFENFSSLSELRLDGCIIEPASLSRLLCQDKLQKLSLSGSPSLSRRIFELTEAVKNQSSLKSLDVSSCRLASSDLPHLLEISQNLQRLSFDDTAASGDALVTFLYGLSRIRSLRHVSKLRVDSKRILHNEGSKTEEKLRLAWKVLQESIKLYAEEDGAELLMSSMNWETSLANEIDEAWRESELGYVHVTWDVPVGVPDSRIDWDSIDREFSYEKLTEGLTVVSV